MAHYIRRCSKYLMPCAIAAGSTYILVNNVVNDESNTVYASRQFHEAPPNPTHLIGIKWDTNWDRRNPANIVEEKGIQEEDKNYTLELAKAKPKATRNIFLIRHGQYNLKGANDEERVLTDLGKSQAEFTGKRLRELDFPFNVMFRSTMTRAKETADIILDFFKDHPIEDVRNCSLLEEGAPIPPEPPISHWRPEVHYFRDGPRIEAAFRKYFHRADASQEDDSYELIVCHSNVIRYFVCRALQFPPDAWLRFTIHHCSITWLVITPGGRVIVRSIGDSGHIPSYAVTSN